MGKNVQIKEIKKYTFSSGTPHIRVHNSVGCALRRIYNLAGRGNQMN